MKEGVELVKWFSEMSNKDVAIAGGKGASLAEMYNSGFPVPPGFVVTAQAYQYFINSSGIASEMHRILSNTNVDDTNALTRASEKIRAIIENADLPKNMEEAITEAYDVLDVEKNYSGASKDAMSILKHSHEPPFVAVRSSATAEDLVDASFAGQQDSFLSVKGKKELIEKIKKCISSLFTPRAIYYRQKKGFAHESTYLAVVVQRMIDSDKSGVMFSKNPIKNDGNVVIEAVWGLGEGIVSGRVSPDHYVVNQEMEVLEMSVSDKKEAMVRKSSGGIEVVKLVEERSKQQVLTGHEIKRLAQYGLDLEEHYKKPQDIEFAIEKGQIYIVQSRPITTKAHVNVGHIEGHSLLSGMGASPGVGSGPVIVVLDLKDLDNVKKGDILVTKMTNPDMVVAMQRAAGIITDEGGVTSHAAIVSREMGIPAVVGTRDATHKLKTGQIVTVDGNTGRILEGKAQEKKVEIKQIVPTKTKIKVIVDLPDYAIRAASSGALGVGLVRLETIIAASGKHPVLFLKNNKMKDYVSILYSGLKKIVASFDEVWVRSSDIRSDEFRNLEGAPQKVEGNPMMGDHGIRFTLKNYDMMEAEFMAVKEIADEFPDKKIGFMAPQIISVEELRAFKKVGSDVGLPENVKIGIMVETPAAVEIIDLLCDEGIDFISLGTNDLTQFTLALDRNNEDVQNLYTEMHPAVLRSIERVLSVCNEKGVETSICGQAGSKPEMASFLVKNGISSISVNADAAFAVSQTIAKIEEEVVDEEPMVVPKNNNKNTQVFDEEAIFLKALEDEYSPGLTAASEVPSLNDAIPIDSDAFVGQKKEEYFQL